MTIRKRLFVSNILMVLVPVCCSLLIGSFCIGIVWYVVEHGTGTGFEDSEDFSTASRKLSGRILKNLESGNPNPAEFEKKYRRRSLTVVINKNGAMFYTYGERDSEDATLLKAMSTLGGEGTIMQQARNLYARTEGEWQVLLFGSNSLLSRKGLIIVTFLSVILIALAIFVSVFFTDRFLMRFVFRRIEEPLDLLAEGVQQIREGNLDYHIVYNQNDEFTPLCNAFNGMAQRLKASVEKANKDEKSRKELLAGISHDLRSPLTSIQAYVEGLLDGIPQNDEARNAYLLTIKNKAEDIDKMVSQLFLFSKLEMEDFPMPMKEEQLDVLIRTWVDANKDEYRERGLLLKETLTEQRAMVNEEQFLRILDNVAQNSLKYKKKQTGTLSIDLKGDGDEILLRMFDDGPGVPQEALPKLLDVFYRGDPSRQNPNKGSGLGLAITERIAHRMGGTIKASIGPEGGLEIDITLRRNA
jgi:signal transduction histidine kinase